jgi:hypothetical protein
MPLILSIVFRGTLLSTVRPRPPLSDRLAFRTSSSDLVARGLRAPPAQLLEAIRSSGRKSSQIRGLTSVSSAEAPGEIYSLIELTIPRLQAQHVGRERPWPRRWKKAQGR